MAEINNFDEFKEAVKNFITEKSPDCDVKLIDVPKNNGICLSGITVRQENANTNVSPTIYLEPYYDKLQSGKPFDEISLEIICILERGMEDAEHVNINIISDFELAKDRICYRLINKSANTGFLKTVPHRDFHDLAIVYYILLDSTDTGVSSIKITNSMAQHFGVDEEQLYALACKNTPTLSRGKVMPMADVMSGLVGESSTPPLPDDGRGRITADGFDATFAEKHAMPYYIATNANGVNGASVILYDGFLKTVGEKLGSFFALPSSIHEWLIIPEGLVNGREMLQMVREVNETAVSAEEVLSNNCYYYDASNHDLQMIS